MDPLSVTLAVVSLATTVKDLVELGQKLHESFAKVSNNLRNVQRIAEDIKEMIEEIKSFCNDHEGVVDNMNDFSIALQGLLAKFRGFDASILPLLPQTGGRRQDRLVRGWDAWKNNNKIEERIINLQADVVKLMRRYMIKSTMRTEVRLEKIHRDTRKGFADVHNGMTQGLVAIQQGISALQKTAASAMSPYSYKYSGTTSDEFNRNVVILAQSTPSTSLPTLRTPDVMTDELMTTAYIRLQLNSIAVTVKELSAQRLSTPSSDKKFQLSPYPDIMSMSITRLRHHVVRQVTGIHDLLDAEIMQSISISAGASALHELSLGLQELRLGPDSILVGNWAIVLARALVNASEPSGGQADLHAKLALYLFNQSLIYCQNGDRTWGLQTIEEAHTITRNLWDQYGGERVHFQILYSKTLLQYAELVNNQQAIKMSITAIQILEDILNVRAFTQSKSDEKIEGIVQPTCSFLNHLLSSALPKSAIINYALSLNRLGTYLLRDGYPESALDLGLLATAVRREIVSLHGQKYKADLAWTLSSMVLGKTAGRIPAKKLVDIIEECIQLLEELAVKNPLSYARELVSVLWVKAETLAKLNRDTEAIATLERAASLAEQIIQDSKLHARALGNLSDQFRRLKRYRDAVRTGRQAIDAYHQGAETQALRYSNLSKDLQKLYCYKESADAAQKSVAQYHHLAMKNPGIWMSNLIDSLSNLTYCLAAFGDYHGAFMAWRESASMLDNFLNTHSEDVNGIEKYLDALEKHTSTSYILKNNEESLKICSSAVQYLRRLSDLYPHNEDMVVALLWAESYYAYNLYRVGHLRDAHVYIDDWLDKWSSKLDVISDSGNAATHAAMVLLKADVLDAQGYTEQALLIAQEMIDSMIYEARLRLNLGNSEGVIEVTEGALRLSRDSKLEPIVENLVWSLHAVALTALLCRNYKRAVEAAQEGCNIASSSKWRDSEDEHNVFIHPGLFAILSSAEANLGRYTIALEYAHHAVKISLEIGNMRSHISGTTAEQSYMKTRWNLADILVVTGDLAQARRICEERQAYLTNRVDTRIGDYRDLAPVLRMLGILCCNEGRHEEGNTAAQKLSRTMRTLGSAFPSLQEQVKIRLLQQAEVPILQILNDMSDKLDCGHQTEVGSLFAI
ncbi:hypothetical protein D9619_008417 [Psilocybe cf. subviscida]|uniref:Uncharacterized protein n=1 Tax=Psilocybe cf. subviscida TaxID=2480587 RepID=A0A8H5BAC9_9AGAR|nr:hypothetical protein D9619_008417 [Psilocybe cf. subviscida]